MKAKNEIILFENDNVKLEVNIQDETVWLTQKQMAELFDKDRKTISRHIQNIYKDNELEENSVCSFFEHTAEDGKNYKVQYYNLDMIISVGYRVNSKRGIAFRKCASKILKDYMIKGYAINQKRLDYLEKTIKLIDIATRLDENLRSDENKYGNNMRDLLRMFNDEYLEKLFNALSKFKKGGKFNIIPEGALHARKHNMDVENIT